MANSNINGKVTSVVAAIPEAHAAIEAVKKIDQEKQVKAALKAVQETVEIKTAEFAKTMHNVKTRNNVVTADVKEVNEQVKKEGPRPGPR